MEKRRQINFRTDEEVEDAIEDIRKMVSPIPTVSEVLRLAVLDYRDKIARKVEAQSRNEIRQRCFPTNKSA